MATPTLDRAPAVGDAPAGPLGSPQIGEAQRRFWLIVDAMIAALVVIALVGTWAYTQVRGSLRDVRAAGLTSLLEIEVRALQLWIGERRGDAERWALNPQVQREGARLAATATTACEAGSQRAFREAIAPYMAVEEVAIFNLVGRDGRILSSPEPHLCGLQVTESFRRVLAPVFEGGTTFAGPWEESARVPSHAAITSRGPLVWAETPIRNADGEVVAALGFGRLAAARFANLLTLTTGGTTRDAFAFDADARIVTQPRDGSKRSVAGTALAAAALDRSQGSQGVLLEPYQSYREARVIAAWRWLPEERLAVAVEVDAEEAYGPLEYLQLGFGALFALVLVSMTAAASTSLWALRARMREARRVGQYEIEREIGEGGMSHVYLARHLTLKRPAAVKVLKPHLATDEAVARFRREAQLCSQLTHPNTVEVFDYGTTREGRWYYAMEYLDGLSIDQVVQRSGPMPLARAAHALVQACGPLSEAHAHGWVHRDVKPQNLLLCVRGGRHDVLKLLDFGIVKQVRNPDTRDITQYSRILGTPLYMAPERLRNPADADARADVYALGAVAWFALAGRPAFAAETEHDIVYRVLNEPAPRLGDIVEGVPPELEALLAACLAKDRADRPATIEAVHEVLARLAREHPWSENEARGWWARYGASAVSPTA